MTQIAFIGLGNMGGPMALNLIKAGHALRVFDLSPAALEAARTAGATVAANPAEAVKGAEAVVSMLPASKHVESLYLGAEGLLAQIAPGTLVIDCSTIAPASSRKVAEAAQAPRLTSRFTRHTDLVGRTAGLCAHPWADVRWVTTTRAVDCQKECA